jgi:hypothetical protein
VPQNCTNGQPCRLVVALKSAPQMDAIMAMVAQITSGYTPAK